MAKISHKRLKQITTSKYNKCVVLDLNGQDYLRYIYVLCLMLIKHKYTVILLTTPKNLARISVEKYAKQLLNLEEIIISNKSRCEITKEAVYIHLYSSYFTDNTGYKIPICQHPIMYELNIAENHQEQKRSFSIFFAGDFRESLYTTLSQRGFFHHLDRIALCKLLLQQTKEMNLAIPLDFIQIIDNADQRLTPHEFKERLSSSTFFLALPGIHMPLSHNIAEAMSCGSIPFIHTSYASLFNPPLNHMENAYIYDSFDTIGSDLLSLSKLPAVDIKQMHKNTLNYYKGNLSSEAVVSKLLAHDRENVFLLAEWNSIPEL